MSPAAGAANSGPGEKWKLLGNMWQLIHDPLKLNSYVESEVRNFLSGREQQVRANKTGLPSAPNHR